MSRLALILFLSFLSLAFATETATQLRKQGEEKLKWLVGQSAKTPLVRLTTNTFKTYVANGPRPYSLMVIFTALGAQYKCEICQQMNHELVPLAKWYQDYRNKDGQLNHKGFFVVVDFEENQEIFRQMQLQSAPVVIFMPASESGNSTRVSKLLAETSGQNNYNINKWGVSAEKVQNFFVSRSAIGYDLVPSYTPPPDYTNLIVLSFFAVSFITMIKVLHSTFPSLFYSPMLYFSLALVFFMFCASGGIYNIIRGMPFSHQQDGHPQYFHPDSSQQFGMESVIVGFLYTSTCILFILLTSHNVISDSKGSPRLTLMILLLAGVQVVFSFLRGVYTKKNPSYNYGYVTR